MSPMITDADIERAAREIFDRYGDKAVARARERVEELEKARDHRALDVALRVLSMCERLVGTAADPDRGGPGPTTNRSPSSG